MKAPIIVFIVFTQILFVAVQAFAQKNQSPSINGLVKDDLNRPVSSVTVELHAENTSLAKMTTVTDSSGQFTFYPAQHGIYHVQIKSINHEIPSSNSINYTGKPHHLGIIMLMQRSQHLAEVQIVGKKNFMEVQADKTSFHIENSSLSDGSSALDMLNKLPGISVSNDGQVSIKGKNQALILINGNPTYLSSDQLANLLRGTSSLDIQKIEVSTNPSAKYDATGQAGILNIVLKKNKKPGFNGQGSLYGGAGRGLQGGGSLQLNYSNRGSNWFASYNQYYQNLVNKMQYERLQFADDNPVSRNVQSNAERPKLRSNNFRFGLDQQLSAKSSVGLMIQGGIGKYPKDEQSYNSLFAGTSEQLIWRSVTDNQGKERWEDLLANINYLYKFNPETEIRLDIDYVHHYSKMDQAFKTTFSNAQNETIRPLSARIGDIPSKNKIWAAKLDYFRPLGKHLKLEFGYKGNWIQMDNDLQYDTLVRDHYERDAATSNHYQYEEQIQAGYASLQYQHNKWQLQLGLRSEYTQSEGAALTQQKTFRKSYINVFPTGFVSYKASEHWTFQWSGGRRINRPSFWDMNPFRSYADAYSYYEGNPDLNPSFSTVLEGNILFKNKYQLQVSRTSTDDMINEWMGIDSLGEHLFFEKPVNMGDFKQHSISLTLPYQMGRWSSSIFMQYYNNRFTLPVGATMESRSLSTFQINSQQQFNMGKNWAIEATGKYSSKKRIGIHRLHGYGSLGMALQKSILQSWQIKLSANNIWQTRKQYFDTDSYLVKSKGSYDRDRTSILLQLTYRFGKQTQSNDRQTSSQDMKDRL